MKYLYLFIQMIFNHHHQQLEDLKLHVLLYKIFLATFLFLWAGLGNWIYYSIHPKLLYSTKLLYCHLQKVLIKGSRNKLYVFYEDHNQNIQKYVKGLDFSLIILILQHLLKILLCDMLYKTSIIKIRIYLYQLILKLF